MFENLIPQGNKIPEEAAAFIDGLVKQKNAYAIKLKIFGLIHGEYGYKKDPEADYALARKELISDFDHPPLE